MKMMMKQMGKDPRMRGPRMDPMMMMEMMGMDPRMGRPKRQGPSFADWKKKILDKVANALTEFKEFVNYYGKITPFELKFDINKIFEDLNERAKNLLEPLFKEARSKLKGRYQSMEDFKKRVTKGKVNIIE